VTGDEKCKRFERLIVPHLDAAYDLARWLTRDPAAAQEAVQEAYLRAYRFFDSFHGDDGRAWVLAIVRNTCFTLLDREPPRGTFEAFDEEVHADTPNGLPAPEDVAITREAQAQVHGAVAALPEEFREVVVLRELHGLSYKEIAAVTNAPIGTVMSRLARGRKALARTLGAHTDGD
jgi:RNA polymerase sigma-70 factor (ECF subfamily)